jgi:hypothetical protein
MGLLQRSFLDLVESSRKKLQVALVVDATDSMQGELAGIRRAIGQMVGDLTRYKGADVSFQLVLFRDAGAETDVGFPLRVSGNQFTRDLKILEEGLAQMRPETGAPYFPELIDLGIHKALTELDWSSDADTTRWVLAFGDAPPFQEGFSEPETRARRAIATNQLIATATRLGIQISCVLCPTRPEDQTAYEQVLPETQEFMNRLATETGGLMLDLSFPDIRAALEQAARPPSVAYTQIGRLTRDDVRRLREEAIRAKNALAEGQRVRMAILPHMPLDQLDFDPTRDAVQIAAEIRHRMRNIPGTELKSPIAVERQYAILRARGVQGPALLQTLAQALGVDYLVWGDLSRDQGSVLLTSAIYSAQDGKTIAEDQVRSGPQMPVASMSGKLVTDLMNSTVQTGEEVQLVSVFRQVRDAPGAQAALVGAVASEAARSDLLEGFETLERALAFPVGQADEQLQQARAALERAVKRDAANPLAYLLLANCCYNQAQSAAEQGNQEQAAAARDAFDGALRKAYTFREQSGDFAYVQREIEADYALLIRKDPAAAIPLYRQLAGSVENTPLRTALRAHWMLAGIYAGDWQVADRAPELLDREQSRLHLLQILAHWEESSEAQFIRKNLRWDDQQGGSQFEFFPRTESLRAENVVDT